WVPIVAAFIAALTASVGYFLTQRVSTIQARRQTYASALLAVESYKQRVRLFWSDRVGRPIRRGGDREGAVVADPSRGRRAATG
ncbi:MAG TPA: hypothetical protein VF062_25635, partial [Candidatus Limnocylindrales bacterium]